MLDNYIQQLNKIAKLLIRMATEMTVELEVKEQEHEALKEKFKIINFPIDKIKLSESAVSKNPKKKEFSDMPHINEAKLRFHKGTYEYRLRKNGLNVSFSAKTVEQARKKLADYIQSFKKEPVKKNNRKSIQEIGERILELKKPTISKKEAEIQKGQFKNYILKQFQDRDIRSITDLELSKFYYDLYEKKGRTSESIYTLLKAIFEYALDEGYISKNPMRKIKYRKSNRTNGTAISLAEEKILIERIKGTHHENVIILMLYAGLRPCEVKTARIEGNFIVTQSMKQKNQKIVFRKIPITPMMRPYIPIIKDIASAGEARKVFNQIFPNHKLYDLRHTFITRCQECGVPENIVGVWAGHKNNTMTGSVYTHFSDEFMIKEGKKITYKI